MFYALPAETVFEAKQRTRRATVYLFLMLAFLYVAFFNLLLITFFLLFYFREFQKTFPAIPTVAYCASALAVGLAVLHFFAVRARGLEDMLAQIGAVPADPKDSYHAQFINIVSEAEAATGIHGIRPVVISNTGSNAFSLQDGKGQCAIGATEGLLSRLNRVELSSVVAHEAAHLVHEDSRLITTATFLFGVFEKINATLGTIVSTPRSSDSSPGSYRLRAGGGQFTLGILLLWLISGLGYAVTRLVFMVISREREYYADADGVQMCKDPLAMAESIYKISNRYRGDLPGTYGALFILNPSDSILDEQDGFFAGLFSNHPPVAQRLAKLLNWAKTDLKTLQERVDQEEKEPPEGSVTTQPISSEGPAFMAYQDNQWTGPYNPLQLLAMGFMSPSTWVCPSGGQQVMRASDAPELLPLFLQQVQGAVSQSLCPRCKVPLVTTRYEGAEVAQCSFCKGHLLKGGVLERLIARDEGRFSPEEIQKARM